MRFCFYFLSFTLSFSTIQYHLNWTNSTVVGSTRVSIEHVIGNFDSNSNPNNANFVPLEKQAAHLDGDKTVDTTEIEYFLLSGPQKNPIYFAYDTKAVQTSFTHVYPIKKIKLQNVI